VLMTAAIWHDGSDRPRRGKKAWDGLENSLVKQLLKPTVYSCQYNGLRV
jgi:hypothetical protein